MFFLFNCSMSNPQYEIENSCLNRMLPHFPFRLASCKSSKTHKYLDQEETPDTVPSLRPRFSLQARQTLGTNLCILGRIRYQVVDQWPDNQYLGLIKMSRFQDHPLDRHPARSMIGHFQSRCTKYSRALSQPSYSQQTSFRPHQLPI